VAYLQVEKVFVLVGLKAQQVGVVLVGHFFEDCVEGEDDEIDQFKLAIEVHPREVSLALGVLHRLGVTVATESSPFSLRSFTFLEWGSNSKRPALTAYR
jgi:cell division protein FtsX